MDAPPTGMMFENEPIANVESKTSVKAKKKKHKKKSKYIYTLGNRYPGLDFGHKNCTVKIKNVPAKMGWLWTSHGIFGGRDRPGWRPGLIGKTIRRLMNIKIEDSEEFDSLSDLSATEERRRTLLSITSDHADENEEQIKPTLLVTRRGDLYTVTMHPLKDPSGLVPGETPYMDCDPIVFRIVRKKTSEEIARKHARKMSKLRNKCEKELRVALEKIAQNICVSSYVDIFGNDPSALDDVIAKAPDFEAKIECTCDEVVDDSESGSDSEWDLEYTPPLAGEARKPDLVHVETQYCEKDLVLFRSKSGLRKRNMSKSRASMRSQ